jgi:crotonobetainyl-CoA:carnitine CoA-transferase CaiB-like acyl-CoA transferase
LTIALTTRGGCDVVRGLARLADIFVENAIPGVMADRGLAYEDLKEINPRLVYVSVTGYGHGNELSHLPGFDYTGAAFSGLTGVTGFRAEPPVLPGYAVVDFSAATFGALGALQAVYRRDCPGGTGRGEWVDVALFEPMLRYSTPMIPWFVVDGIARPRDGSIPDPGIENPGNLFGYVYEASDDLWVAIAPAQHDHKHHARLMNLIDRPDLATDESMVTYSQRKTMYVELDKALRAWTARHPAARIVTTLREAGIPSSVVNTAREIVAEPVIQQRDLLAVHDEFAGRDIPMQGVLPRMIDEPGRVRWPGEPLGHSNVDVYCGLLGWSEKALSLAFGEGLL